MRMRRRWAKWIVYSSFLLFATGATGATGTTATTATTGATGAAGQEDQEEMHMTRLREQMVIEQIEARGVIDSTVLSAMRSVPRHRFVPTLYQSQAYDDHPLPIGEEQTISQPFIVAVMTEALELSASERVLEVGTGSGYQAAVLSEIVSEVYSIEIIAALGLRAESTLATLGYHNVTVRIGDGYQGWAEQAPFDAIIVTAAPDHIPQPLVDQLAMGGRLVIPVGHEDQSLLVLKRTKKGIEREKRFGVRFVPMTGEAEKPRQTPNSLPEADSGRAP
jgi:protein-L-isoaspartate(D-aspartate) O-methyltransferase